MVSMRRRSKEPGRDGMRRMCGMCLVVIASLISVVLYLEEDNADLGMLSSGNNILKVDVADVNKAITDSAPSISGPVQEKAAWPGQPTTSLSTSADDMKLVQIGRNGPVDDAREFLLEHLDEFLAAYKNRPDKTNTCGIRINHSLAIYIIAKKLQPSTIIESGVNSGQSTYFFRQACPTAKIISIDPEEKPICGQPDRWIDDTNNEYLTGKKDFKDFDEVNWGQRIKSGAIDPASTLVFIDDHRGFYKRFPTFHKFGFRHVINEDNYKLGEGATFFDKKGFAPKQMWQKPNDPETEWLFSSTRYYREFPPLLPPVLSKEAPHAKKVQGGFLHNSDDLTAIAEPLLRPDISESDKKVFQKVADYLELDATMVNFESYQEFMGYCFICYMELVPLPPSLRTAWKFDSA